MKCKTALVLIFISVLYQVDSKAVTKESSGIFHEDYSKFESNHRRFYPGNDVKNVEHYAPTIEKESIYIPRYDPESKYPESESSFTYGKYDFDESESLNQNFNYESNTGHASKDSTFERDEVFLHQKNKNIKKHSNHKYNGKLHAIKMHNVMNKDLLNSECQSTKLDVSSNVKVLEDYKHTGNKYIDCTGSLNDIDEKPKVVMGENENRIVINVKLSSGEDPSNKKQLEHINQVSKVENGRESTKENSRNILEVTSLPSNRDQSVLKQKGRQSRTKHPSHVLESDVKFGRIKHIPEIEGDEHVPLQEEINNFFSPNFKSFVFNPTAPTEAKFQECKTSKNESGTCRYVQHCLLPSVLSSIEQFMSNVCIIEGRFIGVCCPEFPVHTVQVKWQNVLENDEAEREPVNTPEECGIGTNTRIVGGTDANIKAWPWMAALLNNKKKFFCGGALINNRYVLTAAHCTFETRNNEIVVRLGEFDFRDDEGIHEDYLVAEIKRHGQYNRFTLRNDIALLKLHKSVIFSEFVKTICLPEANKNYIKKIATLAGWGHIQGGISPFISDVLQEASFPVIENKECSILHGVAVPASMICTEAPSKDKGACNGDSGGPLMTLDKDDRWKVIGIVSWGRRGCNTKYPSVFTRVTHYMDWIKEHAV